MMTRHHQGLIAAVLLSLASLPTQAQNILTVRSDLYFDYAMSLVKTSIEAHGYTVAHVQRCDQGLTKAGYETDLYRVIFFGKFDETRQLTRERPELIPYLPLKIAIFAEGEQTIVSAINPTALGAFFADEELSSQFRRWENDLRSILHEVQRAHDEQIHESNAAVPKTLN